MQFIEQLFGLAPDGGSGMFELVILLIPAVAVLVRRGVRRARRTFRA